MEKTTMSVQELSAQMGISLPKAYELVKSPVEDYPSTQNLNEVQETLIDQINEILVQDIFDKAVVNW